MQFALRHNVIHAYQKYWNQISVYIQKSVLPILSLRLRDTERLSGLVLLCCVSAGNRLKLLGES